MRFLHTMIRVNALEAALDFFCKKMGFIQVRRDDYEAGRFSLIFLKVSESDEAEIELTYNWDNKDSYSVGRNFGHLAIEVDNIYEFCEKLQKEGVTILRPPRDGKMAFVRSPDQVSVEFLQKGDALEPKEPWASMSNTGEW